MKLAVIPTADLKTQVLAITHCSVIKRLADFLEFDAALTTERAHSDTESDQWSKMLARVCDPALPSVECDDGTLIHEMAMGEVAQRRLERARRIAYRNTLKAEREAEREAVAELIYA